MRTINNQFSKEKLIPKVTVTDQNGTDVVFGGDSATYGRVYEISIRNNVDQDAKSASMSFWNHPDLESLDPLDSTSDFNDGTISTNLLKHSNEVKIEVSKDGGSSWSLEFEGFVGEVTARRQVDKAGVIDFSPYDKSKPLKDVVIIEGAPNQPLEYYDIDSFDCVDQILDDIDKYEGYSYDFSSLNFNRTISDNPNKKITEYKVKNTNVWDSLKEIFAQTGYKLFFWYDGSDSYDLAVIDPQRGEISSIDHSFTGDFDERRIEHSDKDVRSQVVVFYNDDEKGGERHRVTVSDDTTRQNYGASNFGGNKIHRTMVLKEDENSIIDTEVEAEAYANNALNDLKTPTPDVELSFPKAIPGIQLYDKIEAGGTNDYTVQLGVTSVDYSFDINNQYGTTTIRGAADRVIGEKSYWLNKGQLPDDIDAFKGDRKAPPKPENPPRLEKTTYVDGSGTTRAKVVCYGSHSPAYDVIGYQFRYRVRNIDTGNADEWKYPDQVKSPQKTITGLEVGDDLELEVEYSAIDWENTEWSGLPGDSPYSDTGTISLYTDITPPSAPTNLTVSEEIESLEISWTAPSTSKDGSNLTDLNYYNVYYKSGDVDFDIDNADGSIPEVDSTTVTQHLPANTQRSYKVEAVDSSFNKSNPSSYASGTTKAVADSDIQIGGWSSDLTFSSTDTDTVSWTSGTLTTGDGSSYSINSGNTGNMTSTTYIYFDLNTSSTDLQTTTTASDSVGGSKILIAVASNSTDGAKFQVFGGQGGQFITAEEIAANTITGNLLVSNMTFTTAMAIASGGYIKSNNFDGTPTDPYNNSGTTGFAIESGGDAAFNNADIRGSLNADDLDAGTINFSNVSKTNLTVDQGEITIDASLSITGDIQSDNWDGSSSGWKIEGSSDTMYAADFQTTDGASLIAAGNARVPVLLATASSDSSTGVSMTVSGLDASNYQMFVVYWEARNNESDNSGDWLKMCVRLNGDSTSNYYNGSAGGNGDQWTGDRTPVGVVWADASSRGQVRVNASYTVGGGGKDTPGIFAHAGQQEWENCTQGNLDVDYPNGVTSITLFDVNNRDGNAKMAVYGVNYI